MGERLKKIFLLILAFAFFIQFQNVSACTTGLFNAPCINLTADAKTICMGIGVPSCQTILRASTSFDPNPTETTPCTNCYLEIQDCNGSLIQCDDGSTTTPDWNGITTTENFEHDNTCGSNCKRNGVIEDTLFSPRYTGINEGSRYIRACWYNNGSLVNCSEKPIRIHTYPYTSLVVAGTGGQCWPPSTPDTNAFIQRWNPVSTQSCVISNRLQTNTQVPLVYLVQCNLLLQNSWLILERASIEFNSMNTNPGCGRIQIDQNSLIIMYDPKAPVYSDHNISGEDRNKQTIGYKGIA